MPCFKCLFTSLLQKWDLPTVPGGVGKVRQRRLKNKINCRIFLVLTHIASLPLLLGSRFPCCVFWQHIPNDKYRTGQKWPINQHQVRPTHPSTNQFVTSDWGRGSFCHDSESRISGIGVTLVSETITCHQSIGLLGCKSWSGETVLVILVLCFYYSWW